MKRAMQNDRPIPLKQIAGAIGISRSTLWRARKAVTDFPAPLVVRGRLFWCEDDVPELQEALTRYQGRTAFEVEQRRAALRAEKTRLQERKPARRRRKAVHTHPDLFGWTQ